MTRLGDQAENRARPLKLPLRRRLRARALLILLLHRVVGWLSRLAIVRRARQASVAAGKQPVVAGAGGGAWRSSSGQSSASASRTAIMTSARTKRRYLRPPASQADRKALAPSPHGRPRRSLTRSPHSRTASDRRTTRARIRIQLNLRDGGTLAPVGA